MEEVFYHIVCNLCLLICIFFSECLFILVAYLVRLNVGNYLFIIYSYFLFLFLSMLYITIRVCVCVCV